MSFVSFGGNQVKHCQLNKENALYKVDFAADEYHYYSLSLPIGNTYQENQLKSVTILCLAGDILISLREENETFSLKTGDTLQLENYQLSIESQMIDSTVLLAGVLESHSQQKSYHMTPARNHKMVVKPWGHEQWFNGEHPKYCLKEVMIKKGYRTSLQYHNYKEETNVLIQGTANLIYKNNPAIQNERVSADDLSVAELVPTSIVHVTPQILHRLEAITDVLLYEVSTPFLDDVIRVQDDKLRKDGRIFEEHAL